MTYRQSLFPVPIPERGPIRVLLSCVGRRIELIHAFREAGERLGRRVILWGADQSRLAPGLYHVDRAEISPPIDNPDYLPHLLRLVARHRIHLIVPVIDSDLLKFAGAREKFARAGCNVLISSERVVAVCRDKILAFRHLSASGIDTPATWTWPEARRVSRLPFPLYIKPRSGSAARGHFLCDHRRELPTLARRVPDPILQEYVRGEEYTLDAYAGFDGVPRCVVPRHRLEVRSGEVSKGQIARDPRLMAIGRRVVESLRECVGVVTIQCIRRDDGRILVIEINPRVGGGIPLAIRAGADFPYWILASLAGRRVRIGATSFTNRLTMLRYDSSVFLTLPAASPARRTKRRRRKG
jgi:carbamoyl-phosphate synthase large subunit